MQIIHITDKRVIEKAVKILHRGGILIYPTETCYGVGVDATNPQAVTKVLKYKKRPQGKAISIGCSDIKMSKEYVLLNQTAKNIYKNFLPGPVTVILKSKRKVDPRLESERQTLGIRIPDYDILLEILKAFGKPITTTSANSNGKKTPYSIDDILQNISKKQSKLIDTIIDAGELPKNPPSTVIDTTTEELKTYRSGVFDPSVKLISEFESTSEEETIFQGEEFIKKTLSENTDKAIVVLLKGDLGAGKTYFTKGIAKGLKIDKIIKSPTFIS